MMIYKKATKFLNNNNISYKSIIPFNPDASNRRYFRVLSTSENFILMLDDNLQNLQNFINIADFLLKKAFFAPKIIKADLTEGIAILEDFGDNTFTAVLILNPKAEAEIYQKATKVLIDLSKVKEPSFIPKFTIDELTQRALLFIDYYAPNKSYKQEIEQEFNRLIPKAFEVIPCCIALRDFMVDNLMLLKDGQIGLLDFQDARIAPKGFDLMCLLEDARRDVSPNIIKNCKEQYIKETGVNKDGFELAWSIMGAQRHLKEVGLFAKFGRHYISHIPRILKNIEKSLNHKELKDLKKWINLSLSQKP